MFYLMIKFMKHISKAILFFIALLWANFSLYAQGGISIETAVKATFDTNNTADANQEEQYYYFTPDFNGSIIIGNCGLTALDTKVMVMDSLTSTLIGSNDDYCDYQTSLVMPVDSAVTYIVIWDLYDGTADEIYRWYLVEFEPKPGDFCSFPDTVSEGMNSATLESETKWYEYTATETGVAVIRSNVNIYYFNSECHLEVRTDCEGEYIDYHFLNDSIVAFATSSDSSYILSWMPDGSETINLEWQITREPAMPGDRCETALIADTGSNTFHSGAIPELIYHYQAKKSGRTIIDMCSIPDTIWTNVHVELGTCDRYIYSNIDVSDKYCDKDYFLRSFAFYTDSGSFYTITVDAEPNVNFTWYLHEEEPQPGEYYQLPIPVNVEDTMEIIPSEYSSSAWYKLDATADEMAIISSCGMGNDPHDIYGIEVFKDSVSMINYDDNYYTYDLSCNDGYILEFPTDTGRSYFIRISYNSSIESASWFLQRRDIVDGDMCEQGIFAKKDTIYQISAVEAFKWYDYTPAENEYMVIGTSKVVNEDFFAEINVKLDCDCEVSYSGNDECFSTYNYGKVVYLEDTNTYHIGWKNPVRNEILWSIYEPTQIMDFVLKNQLEPVNFDNEEHTIEGTVTYNQSLENLVVKFVQASGVEFHIDDIPLSSGNSIDCSEPVIISVSYVDHIADDTISQDWTLTVTQGEAPIPGPYTVKSNYLRYPELNKPYVTRWADFWKSAYDTLNGGFYTNIDNEGNPTGNYKTLLSQSRNAYAFSRAFMISGDTTYLTWANRALEYMYDHLWDETNGGWYSSVNEDGSLYLADNYNTYKWSFMQHYAKLGIVAMSDAVGGARFEDESLTGSVFNEHEHWNKLNTSLEVINENMWDDRQDYYGYYYSADMNWSNPTGKGFTPTVDVITTHGLYMYLFTKDPFFETRLEQLANNMEEYLIPGMESAVIGFPEAYSSDWEMESGGDMFIGHMFKTAWCLARAYLVNPQEKYRTASKVLMDDMIDNGAYDYTYGAPYTGYDWTSGYINTNSKSWWDVEQAYTSGIMNYYISEDEDDKNKYLEIADGSIDFFMKYFVDKENGEVYETTSREGTSYASQKGHFWKAGYHSTELAYYAYLYGNLFYREEPVELYYFIDQCSQPQEISLYPLAIEDQNLKIDAVELDGISFENFDSDTRTLHIAANEGGIFKVAFINDIISGLYEPLTASSDMLNAEVYPNPLEETGFIEYTIDYYTDVTIQVLDISGRVIYAIENKKAAPGKHQEIITRSDLGNNNVCFIHIRTDEQSTTKKLVVLD